MLTLDLQGCATCWHPVHHGRCLLMLSNGLVVCVCLLTTILALHLNAGARLSLSMPKLAMAWPAGCTA